MHFRQNAALFCPHIYTFNERVIETAKNDVQLIRTCRKKATRYYWSRQINSQCVYLIQVPWRKKRKPRAMANILISIKL